MMKYSTPLAVLLSSAAFVFPPILNAQVPIVDASRDYQVSENTPPANVTLPPVSSAPVSSAPQGELFYQLQLLQEEVRMLRGQVEEQSYQLQQFKKQATERYIDVDRRLAGLSQQQVTEATEPNQVSSESGHSLVANMVSDAPAEKAAYDAAYQLVSQRQFSEAKSAFQQFLVDYPQGQYAPNAYYWLGELFLVLKPVDLEASRQSFTQLIEQYPAHAKVADAMYKLGTVYYLKDNREKASYWLEKVISDYGNSAGSSASKAKAFLSEKF
mgnify:CR=1 FL=1